MRTKKQYPGVLAIASIGLVMLMPGCATPTTTKTVSEGLPRPGAKVVVGTVTNATGQPFKFDVGLELHSAMVKQLEERQLLAGQPPATGDLLLNLSLAEYRPGNAFKRWVLPGWGCTVLSVTGGLFELNEPRLFARIEHQRTVAAGGFYTIGAEHYIVQDVARDLARDLAVRISRGGEFVVQARSRADAVAATEPRPGARTICVKEVNDRRTETGRIGERHAAFGVSMGDVAFSRSVTGYIRENLELELTAAGDHLSQTNADVNLTCDVNKLWLHTRTTPLYWDVIADITITVSNLSQTPRQREELSATAKKRTYVWPTASLCGDVLEECLAALMTRFRESKVWR